MIFLRAYGSDESVGVSNYVSIPQPIGVQDGDLLVVGISLTDSAIDVAAPDDEWTLVARTDETQTGSVAVFVKFAMNEPSRWVFPLSSTVHLSGTYGLGGVLVYGGVDGFEPVEASASATTPHVVAQNVPAITASEAGEELVLFFGADNAGTLATLSGFNQVVARAPGGVGTFVAQRRRTEAGTQAATTAALSVAAKGACVALALRPSAGTLSVDDVRERLVAALPRGVEDVYDLTASGDYFKYYQSIAGLLKTHAFDLVDLVRREILPHLSRYKLPSWERIFGLETTRVAHAGTIPQRQAQVIGAWRAAAGQGSSRAAVQAVIGPLFGYDTTTEVEIVECDRSALTLLHSYDWTGGVDTALNTSAVNGGLTTFTMVVTDGGKVSVAGATLTLAFNDPETSNYDFALVAPDGTTKTWTGGASTSPLVLRGAEFAGAAINGIWTLRITNHTLVANTLLSASTLFVEGMQRGQSTAGAAFEWGVYADPALLSESGTPANFAQARAMLRRLAFSHTLGCLIRSKAPWPDTESGLHSAIPSEAIPV
jgi:hypothetical protein